MGRQGDCPCRVDQRDEGKEVTNIAHALTTLTPQARTVLSHLERHGKITPMKALIVYGITRLASRMHELKANGVVFGKQMMHDDEGDRYMQYTYPVRVVN